jgi:hypothetical protein
MLELAWKKANFKRYTGRQSPSMQTLGWFTGDFITTIAVSLITKQQVIKSDLHQTNVIVMHFDILTQSYLIVGDPNAS